MTNQIVFVIDGADFSGLGLGKVLDIWTPAEISANILAWFSADSIDHITMVDNKVSALTSLVGTLSVSKMAGSADVLYSPTGWGASPGLAFSWGALKTGSWLRGAGLLHDGGCIVYATLQRGAQAVGTDATVNIRAFASVPGPVVSGVRQKVMLGAYDPVKDAGQTQVFAGQHGNITGSNSNASPVSVGDKRLLVGYYGPDGVSIAISGGTKSAVKPYLGVSTTNYDIGAGNNNNDSSANFVLKELIIATYETSEADRRRIEGYMAWTAGLEATLPDDHPYRADGPYAD